VTIVHASSSRWQARQGVCGFRAAAPADRAQVAVEETRVTKQVINVRTRGAVATKIRRMGLLLAATGFAAGLALSCDDGDDFMDSQVPGPDRAPVITGGTPGSSGNAPGTVPGAGGGPGIPPGGLGGAAGSGASGAGGGAGGIGVGAGGIGAGGAGPGVGGALPGAGGTGGGGAGNAGGAGGMGGGFGGFDNAGSGGI
jgi:hypothetical protein